MKRVEKILFGERVAERVKDFEYGVILTQEGSKAKESNKFRKFIKEVGAITSGGNIVMTKALEKTQFSELYSGLKGSLIAIFFNDKDLLGVLNKVRREFKKFKIVSGLSDKSKLSGRILQNLSKNKNEAQFYSEVKRALISPFKCLIAVLEKLQEKADSDSDADVGIEKIAEMSEKLTLLGIYKVCYKVLERIK